MQVNLLYSHIQYNITDIYLTAGRSTDFSSSDVEMASKAGLKFFTPEQFFLHHDDDIFFPTLVQLDEYKQKYNSFIFYINNKSYQFI